VPNSQSGKGRAMDNETLRIVLTALFGTGGAAAVYAAWRAKQSKKKGAPREEFQAKQTADWDSLNSYWKSETADLRRRLDAARQDAVRARRSADIRALADANYIDKLEAHIWEKLPPPPPRRDTKGTQ